MQKQRRPGWNEIRQTGENIKVQRDQLLLSVRGSQPDLALQRFYGGMSSLCSRPDASLGPSHLNAIIGASAKAWTTAWGRLAQHEQQQALHRMLAFLTEMLLRLQPLMPEAEERQVANIMWSLAKLELKPDVLVPGMTDSLAQQFIANMDVATGEGFSNVLVACAKLQLNPCQGELFKAIRARLTAANLSSFNAQAVANILHSLATLPAAAPPDQVLDALCKRFGALLKSRQAAELPNAQNIANTIWALSELKFAPADELAISMVGRMVTVCRLPGQQPDPQAISNALLACAELSVPVEQADIDSLVSFFIHIEQASKCPPTLWKHSMESGCLRQFAPGAFCFVAGYIACSVFPSG